MQDPIRPRPYYATRRSGGANASIRLEDLRELIRSAYDYYDHAGYFVEAFGSECVDAGFKPGFAGTNVDAYVHLALQRADVWPIADNYKTWVEEDIFTLSFYTIM